MNHDLVLVDVRLMSKCVCCGKRVRNGKEVAIHLPTMRPICSATCQDNVEREDGLQSVEPKNQALAA